MQTRAVLNISRATVALESPIKTGPELGFAYRKNWDPRGGKNIPIPIAGMKYYFIHSQVVFSRPTQSESNSLTVQAVSLGILSYILRKSSGFVLTRDRAMRVYDRKDNRRFRWTLRSQTHNEATTLLPTTTACHHEICRRLCPFLHRLRRGVRRGSAHSG